MARRAAGLAALLLVLATPARAGTLGLAEVRGSDGSLIGKAAGGAYAYPADGSVLRIGSARATAARVELRNGSVFHRRVTVKRLVVMARAAHPATAGSQAAVVLGLPQLPAAEASLAGVPTFVPRLPSQPPPDVPTNTLGGQAVALAYQFLGIPYVWGGATPAGFDCSGLTMYVYGQLGIKLGHYTGFQYYEGRRVPRNQLEPGDLVFFRANSIGVPQHEGMYVGNGSFIQAPHTGDVVRISSLFDTRYALSYVGAVRPYVAGASSSPMPPSWTSASG